MTLISHKNPWVRARRRGFTLIELSAAVAIVFVCLVAFSQLVFQVGRESRRDRLRQAAFDRVQDALERLSLLPAPRRVALDFDRTPFDAVVRRSLPEGTIAFQCEPVDVGTESTRIKAYLLTATVSWSDGEERPARQVSLSRLVTLFEEGEGP